MPQPGAEPVVDWSHDWDHHDEAWVTDPYRVWNQMRGECPMGRTARYNDGTWLPLTYDQLHAIAHDTESFSNKHYGITAGGTDYNRSHMPPINSDPPDHHAIRRLILPFFAPRAIESWRGAIEQHCVELAESIAGRGEGDAAIDYAQHIPVFAIAAILGIPHEQGDQFREWVVDFVERGAVDPALRISAQNEILAYMDTQIAHRRANPGDDLISFLVSAELEGEPLDDDTIRRVLQLQLVAGIDTTWSSIGAAMWHLATHADDRQRLAAEPELISTAIEEFLRAYAPVNVARIIAADTVVDGMEMKAGESVMMSYPIACRDPQKFDNPDQVIIDREVNRHIAFGVGIHRCLGSNLARLEMEVALTTWMRLIPEFELAPGATVRWSEGQIRGPKQIPIVVKPPTA
ncbi:MAG: cytochrome P450 [Acidimicrobiales bacterium]